MTDDEILARIAEGASPSGAQLAVLIAWRSGHGTVEKIQAVTGYGRSTVYNARKWLDENMVGWRGNGTRAEGSPAEIAQATAQAEIVAELVPHPELIDVAAPAEIPVAEHAVEVAEDVIAAVATTSTVPVWRRALADAAAAHVGEKSWDAYRHLYGPAADVCIAEGAVGDLIALAADYWEVVTEDELDQRARKQVAVLIRNYGKAGLYGLNQAIGRTDTFAMSDHFRYATVVAQNVVKRADEIRRQDQEAANV